MLRALTSMFRRAPVAQQLALALDAPEAAPRDADELLARLRAMGLTRITHCRLTKNRNVMVSYRGTELRVHEGYLDAPSEVHEAIVAFIQARTRSARRAAQRQIVAYKVETPSARGRRERMHPEDEPVAAKLAEWHSRLNTLHFGGGLRQVPLRVSRRMKSRLGHYTAAPANGVGEIAISRRHLRRHGWEEVLHTLLHEMVHQWQDENGLPLDHGPRFRAKAREVGIAASATRIAGGG